MTMLGAQYKKMKNGLWPLTPSSFPSWQVAEQTGEPMFVAALKAEIASQVEKDTVIFTEGLASTLKTLASYLFLKGHADKSGMLAGFTLPTVDLSKVKAGDDKYVLSCLDKLLATAQKDDLTPKLLSDALCKLLFALDKDAYSGLIKALRSCNAIWKN